MVHSFGPFARVKKPQVPLSCEVLANPLAFSFLHFPTLIN